MEKTLSVKSASKDSICLRSLHLGLLSNASTVLKEKLFAKVEMKSAQTLDIGVRVTWQMNS